MTYKFITANGKPVERKPGIPREIAAPYGKPVERDLPKPLPDTNRGRLPPERLSD